MPKIESISKIDAQIIIDGVWVNLSLDDEREEVIDDDYHREYRYTKHYPIILDMIAINDDGDEIPLDEHIKKQAISFVETDYFMQAFDDVFAEPVHYGKNVFAYYADF